MANLIERYIYDVVRRLPEKDRGEVSRELNANIHDMLGVDAGDEEIKEVLNNLGPPAILAENYRQKPRYLISPAVYDDYIRALKWVVPLVGCILLAVGAVFGAIDAIKDGMADLARFIGGIFSQGLSFGISGAFQALVWTTIGFVIAERTGYKTASADAWTTDQLPEEIPNDKGKIPLSDSIVELVIIVIFSAIGILLCLGLLPFAFTIHYDDIVIHQMFAGSFLAACVPVILIGCLCGIGECVVKIIRRRWTPLVCGTVIVSNLIGIGLMVYLCTRREIFSPEFLGFVQAQEWGQLDILRFMGTPIENPVIFVIAAIVIIFSVVECCSAVYRTIKARN